MLFYFCIFFLFRVVEEKDRDFCFEISTLRKEFVVAAESAYSRDIWLDRLRYEHIY